MKKPDFFHKGLDSAPSVPTLQSYLSRRVVQHRMGPFRKFMETPSLEMSTFYQTATFAPT